MAITMNELINIITKRTVGYLDNEAGIKVTHQEVNLIDKNRLKLRQLTTLITIGGDINTNVVFSFDNILIDEIFNVYTEGINVPPEDRLECIEETAGDMINIVVGNSTSEFNGIEQAIKLSPPMVIQAATSIIPNKKSQFFMINLFTLHGGMSIFCIGPR